MDVATFTDWSVWFAWGIVRAAVLTIPVFVLAVLVTGLGRRWLAPWGRWSIWSLVLVRLLMPVSIGSPLSLQRSLGSDWSEAAKAAPRSVELRRTQHDKAKPAVPRQPVVLDATPPNGRLPSPLPAGDARFAMAGWIALVVLLAGMACMALWTLITTVRLHRWLRRGTECRHEAWLQGLAEGRKRFGITGPVELRVLSGLGSPATCGWLRPTILLPEDMLDWSPAEIRHILWHELAHIRRRDVAASAGLTVVRILHWWNPVFWWTQRCWLLERELACDAMVLRQLERGDAPRYGATLLRVVEHLVDRQRAISPLVPGFAFFLGRKQAVRRRLMELLRSATPETRAKRWIALGAIACLAVISLTDPVRAQPAPLRASIALPAGTIWAPVPRGSVPDIAHESREYDLAPSIDRVWQDEPTATRAAMIETMGHVFRMSLQTPQENGEEVLSGRPDSFSRGGGGEGGGSSCEIRDETLVVQGTPAQHAEIEGFLTRWSRDGQRPITVSVRMGTTGLSLDELLPGPGGTVLSPSGGGQETDRGTVASLTKDDVPVFVRTLSSTEVKQLTRKLQSDRKNSVLFAPTMQLRDGQLGSICNAHPVRRFVTALQPGESGRLEPVVSQFRIGRVVQARPMIEPDGGTRLAVHCRIAELIDVDQLQTTVDGKDVTLQVPRISSLQMSTVQSVPAGYTLLLSPLRRDAKGRVLLVFVSAAHAPWGQAR